MGGGASFFVFFGKFCGWLRGLGFEDTTNFVSEVLPVDYSSIAANSRRCGRGTAGVERRRREGGCGSGFSTGIECGVMGVIELMLLFDLGRRGCCSVGYVGLDRALFCCLGLGWVF